MKNIIIIFSLFFSIASCTKQKTELKLAHGLDQSHSVHKAMVRIAENLNRNSNGKMTIKIYQSRQIGTERECLELLQLGSLDMTKVSAAVLEGFVEEYKVFGLPYIFKSKNHMFSILDGEIGQQILDKGDKFWLKGLCYFDAGSRSFYTIDRQIESPDDLSGLKIRVMKSNTAVNMVKALGGAPTPISWGELYTALQSGVVDGAENNPPSFYLSRHYEVCKYYSLDEHTSVPDVLLIGLKTWNKLSSQQKEWLKDAVDSAVPYQRELWAKSELEALEAVKKEGVLVHVPDKKPFVEKVQKMYESYNDDPVLGSLIKMIQSNSYEENN